MFIDLNKYSVSVWSVLNCKRLYSTIGASLEITSGQYFGFSVFGGSGCSKNHNVNLYAKNASIVCLRQHAHAHVLHSSWVSRKFVTQETTWRDERLSRHALTTAFSRMSHAERIHFPLEVPFHTQTRSERKLLSVSLQARGRAAVDFTSFMQHELHLHLDNCTVVVFEATWKFTSLWASGESFFFSDTLENHNQDSLLFVHNHP